MKEEEEEEGKEEGEGGEELPCPNIMRPRTPTDATEVIFVLAFCWAWSLPLSGLYPH